MKVVAEPVLMSSKIVSIHAMQQFLTEPGIVLDFAGSAVWTRDKNCRPPEVHTLSRQSEQIQAGAPAAPCIYKSVRTSTNSSSKRFCSAHCVVGAKHLHVSFDFILTTDRLHEQVRVMECKSEGAQLTVGGEPGTPAIVSKRHTLMRTSWLLD